MTPTTLILRTAGTNCDRELIHAFETAGAKTISVHLNELIADPAVLQEVDIVGFPGGFSFGDDIAAGRIFANRLRHRLAGPLHAALERGVPMIGICNGFQVLVKLGLLPFPQDMLEGRQSATLADNVSGRFTDKWVSMTATPADASVCIWTQGLSDLGPFDLPIAHGEGRFTCASGEVMQRLRDNRQIALRYVPAPANDAVAFRPGSAAGSTAANFPGNPNGSMDDIAGVCDPSGLVLGLMPHPERHVTHTQHPLWTRLPRTTGDATPAPGLRFFQNAVRYVQDRSAAAVTH